MDWWKYVNKKVYGYNWLNYNMIGFLLFYLFFGCYFFLLVVIVLLNKRVEEEFKSRVFYIVYVIEWKKCMEEVYYVVFWNISKSVKCGKFNYDFKGYSLVVLNVGDYVFVCNLLEKGGLGKNCDFIGSKIFML